MHGVIHFGNSVPSVSSFLFKPHSLLLEKTIHSILAHGPILAQPTAHNYYIMFQINLYNLSISNYSILSIHKFRLKHDVSTENVQEAKGRKTPDHRHIVALVFNSTFIYRILNHLHNVPFPTLDCYLLLRPLLNTSFSQQMGPNSSIYPFSASNISLSKTTTTIQSCLCILICYCITGDNTFCAKGDQSSQLRKTRYLLHDQEKVSKTPVSDRQ